MGELATEKQKGFAVKLGIAFDEGVTKSQISELIDDELLRRDPPRPEIVEFANHIEICDAEAITNSELKKHIFSQLKYGDDDEMLCLWFAYRVCRDRHLKFGGEDFSLRSEVVSVAAGRLFVDDSARASIRRYSDGDLNYFGQFEGRGGVVLEGGSRRTKAYKIVRDYLDEMAVSRQGVSQAVERNSSTEAAALSKSEGVDWGVPLKLFFFFVFIVVVISVAR